MVDEKTNVDSRHYPAGILGIEDGATQLGIPNVGHWRIFHYHLPIALHVLP